MSSCSECRKCVWKRRQQKEVRLRGGMLKELELQAKAMRIYVNFHYGKTTRAVLKKDPSGYCMVSEIKGTVSKRVLKLKSPEINEPIKKWASKLNRTFSKEEIQMAKKYMKKCSPPLAIKEMQIKTTLIPPHRC
jgi:hypothetical protein